MPEKIVPSVTPFDGYKVNTRYLRHHIEQLLSDGVDLVLLCGTTGLGPSLSREERVEMLESVRDYAGKIIFHVGTLNLSDSLELAKVGRDYGVRALSSLPPYYFPRIKDDWVVKHLVQISNIHPTILYNYPLAVGYDATSAIAKRILEEGGNLVGVKDTQSDIAHMLSYKYELGRDFRVYAGPDSLILSAARSGLDGAVAGTGNYAAELLVKLLSEPEAEDAFDMQRLLTDLAMVSRKYGQWSANYAMTKIARGYEAGDPRPPFFPLSAEEVKKLEQEMKTILALPANRKFASYFKRLKS